MFKYFQKLILSLLVSASCLMFAAWAKDKPEYAVMTQSNSSGHQHKSMHDHSAHMAMLNKTEIKVSHQNYVIPDVSLLDQNGQLRRAKRLLDSDKTLVVNFIFTSCKTICPVLSNSLMQMQQVLPKQSSVEYVSVSIDPQYDRPSKLKSYAKNFDAGNNWLFLTGDDVSVLKITQAFSAYNGSKMNHKPVTFIKTPEASSWVRIDGLATGQDLADIYLKSL